MDYRIVEINDQRIKLTQHAYLTDDGKNYTAVGYDISNGQLVKVYWANLAIGHVNDGNGSCKICKDGDYCQYEDEADCADWNNPDMSVTI